jgi:hypothetical protein
MFFPSAGHDGIAEPPPTLMLQSEAAVGDLLLDDVAQVQNVAPGQLPKPQGCFGIQDAAENPRHQSGDLAAGQGLQVHRVESGARP